MPIPRSRGAASGLMLVLLGLWGGLIPFVGPTFGLAIGPDDAWHWTEARLWLEVLPAIAVVGGGALLMTAVARGRAALGATLAVAGGVWFLVGPTMSMLWNDGLVQAGAAHGSTGVRVLAWLALFSGLGAFIVMVSAWSLGRLSVVTVQDAELAHTRVMEAQSPAVAPTARPAPATMAQPAPAATAQPAPAPTAGRDPGATTATAAAATTSPASPAPRDKVRRWHLPLHRRSPRPS